jgi:protein-S-isoprenylcysteine O-methyltransferase Ste14
MPSYDVKYTRTQDGYRKTVRRRHPFLFWLVAFPLALSVVLSHLWTGLALIAILLLCAYANLKAAQNKK